MTSVSNLLSSRKCDSQIVPNHCPRFYPRFSRTKRKHLFGDSFAWVLIPNLLKLVFRSMKRNTDDPGIFFISHRDYLLFAPRKCKQGYIRPGRKNNILVLTCLLSRLSRHPPSGVVCWHHCSTALPIFFSVVDRSCSSTRIVKKEIVIQPLITPTWISQHPGRQGNQLQNFVHSHLYGRASWEFFVFSRLMEHGAHGDPRAVFRGER